MIFNRTIGPKIVTTPSKISSRPIRLDATGICERGATDVPLEKIVVPESPTATILITTYNRCEQLKFGLSSLAKQKSKYLFDVLVLNDGLPDESESVCKTFEDQLNVSYLFTGSRNLNQAEPHWRTPGYALNIGIKKTPSDIVFVTCAEMYQLNNDVVEACVNQLIKNPNSTVTVKGVDDCGVHMERLRSGGALDSKIVAEDKTSWKLNIKQPFFMGMFRKHLLNIGGYDEDFTGIGYDDDDLVYRLNTYGLEPLCLPTHTMVHLYHPRIWGTGTGRESINRDLFNARKNPMMLRRNKEREWGVLTE